MLQPVPGGGGSRGKPRALTRLPLLCGSQPGERPGEPRALPSTRCHRGDGLTMRRCCEGVGLPCLFKVSLTCLVLAKRGWPISSQGEGAGSGSPSRKPRAWSSREVSGCCWGHGGFS